LENMHTSGISLPEINNRMGMSLFPNPAANIVTLEYDNILKLQNTSVTLSDMLGRQILNHRFDMQNGKGDEQISTAGLPNGIYIVTVESGGQILFSNKLIITK